MMQQGLHHRIASVLAGDPDEILFVDRHGALTRAQVTDKIDIFITRIHRDFVPGAGVGLAFPNSSELAIAILACILSDHPPTVFHHDLRSRQSLIGTEAAQDGLVLFTSGSEGKARGVEIPFDAILYLCDLMRTRARLTEATVSLIALPMSHVMALCTQFFPTLLAGGICHFLDQAEMREPYHKLLNSGATFLTLVPEALKILARENTFRALPPALAVRDLSLAGEAILPLHRELARKLFPNARIHLSYGLTEAPRVVSVDSDDPFFNSGCAGVANPQMEIRIVGEDGQTVPPRQNGMILIRGPTLARRYLDGPLNLDENGFLNTGDLGWLDEDGRLFVDGRTDRVFKINGRKVSPSEIESLCTQLNFIEAAKCIGSTRNGRIRMTLFLVLQAASPTEEVVSRIEAQLKKLSSYKRPERVFVLPEMPKIAIGKLDVIKLLELDIQPEKVTYLRSGIEFLVKEASV